MLSSRARLRFTNREHHAVNSIRRSSILQPTANYLLTVCLTPGGKRTLVLNSRAGTEHICALMSFGPVGICESCHTQFSGELKPGASVIKFTL